MLKICKTAYLQHRLLTVYLFSKCGKDADTSSLERRSDRYVFFLGGGAFSRVYNIYNEDLRRRNGFQCILLYTLMIWVQ